MSSYNSLATIYETLMKDCDYDKWSQYLLTTIKKYTNGKNGLDLACGSGKMTRLLAGFGFKMVGGDLSEEMLTQAKNISLKEKLKIDYFLADLTNLSKYGSFDFVTIINDGINYVPHKKIEKTFKGISKNLKKDGILIFDISTRHKLQNVIGNNLFGEDYEDFSYLWFNCLKEDRVEMDLSFFIKDNNNFYKKTEEKHIQYIHDSQELINLASKCNLELLEYDLDENLDRQNFVFRRK